MKEDRKKEKKQNFEKEISDNSRFYFLKVVKFMKGELYLDTLDNLGVILHMFHWIFISGLGFVAIDC